MKIAVVGAGIAGMVSAHLLSKQHEVVLFESESRLGGHTHTVDVAVAERSYAIDTGFIVFNEATYPNFIRLLNQLGVQSQPTQMSFSVSCEKTGLEYAGTNLNTFFAQRRNLLRPAHYRFLLEILRFNKSASSILHAGNNDISLGDWLASEGYSEALNRDYLLPMCAAIWSGSLADAAAFPARHFIEFFNNHGLLQIDDRPQWRVVKGGSGAYIEPLCRRYRDHIELNTPVRGVARHAKGATIYTDNAELAFDAVVLACHSDQALKLLRDPSPLESGILRDLPYQMNDVVLHTDASLLPRRERAGACWNYRLGGDNSVPATVTYDMNRLQGIDSPTRFCVTLNQNQKIAASKILGRYQYAHPLFTAKAASARAQVEQISGANNTWYCGAWRYNGFHEDGVRSALDVAAGFGLSL